MKCYCMTYDLERVAPKTVYVSKNSTFKIGIKAKTPGGGFSTDVTLTDSEGSALTSAGFFEDFLTWKLAADSKESIQQYKVTHADGQAFKLKVVTTGSDVAELDSLGAEDAYTTSNTTKQTISGTLEDGTSFSFDAITA